uniref:Bidirectional sugar transporter SWEET n=1 Tax=Tetradesmus obliquus TaxID=3088 RepID=A0A383V948_TETOB|eukprot:jgi/Sobl393_1/3085/SZX61279.1
MPISTTDILLKHVCPGLGVGIAFVLFSSPLKAVLEVNRKKSLGELNVLPFIAMAANCFSWIIYGYVGLDWYIYFGNIPGLMFGMFYVLTCYKFSKEQAQDTLRNIFLGAVMLFFVVGLVSQAAKLDTPGLKTLWGSTCVAILAIYYAAPLTSLAKVVAQRDSSSLHWPLCCMNVINGTLWFAYGMALKDWFVGVPNGVGAAFNVICVVFCFAFPAKGRSRLAGQVNPAANWGVLRLQSVRHPETGARGFESPATAGGFFDVSQMRWRSGVVGSFLRIASGGRLGSMRRSSAAELGAAAGPDDDVLPVAAARIGGSMDSPADSGTPDCKVQDIDLVVVGQQEKGVEGGKAAAADVEAAAGAAAAGAPGSEMAKLGRDQEGS